MIRPHWALVGPGRDRRATAVAVATTTAVVADRHEQVDLDNAPLGALIVWMDGLTDVDYLINDYAFMRATVAGNTIKVRSLLSPPSTSLIRTSPRRRQHRPFPPLLSQSFIRPSHRCRPRLFGLLRRRGTRSLTLTGAGAASCAG